MYVDGQKTHKTKPFFMSKYKWNAVAVLTIIICYLFYRQNEVVLSAVQATILTILLSCLAYLAGAEMMRIRSKRIRARNGKHRAQAALNGFITDSINEHANVNSIQNAVILTSIKVMSFNHDHNINGSIITYANDKVKSECEYLTNVINAAMDHFFTNYDDPDSLNDRDAEIMGSDCIHHLLKTYIDIGIFNNK